MKSLARPSFFRVFDLLVSEGNPGLKRSHWTHASAEFERERHSFTSPHHGIVIDIIMVTLKGRRGWSLMVTKEYWWGPDDKPFKNLRWARPLGGQRADLFAWLRKQEAALEQALMQEFGREPIDLHSEEDNADELAEWKVDEGAE